MKRILVSGGPVGANLDSVKVITNNFKGGRMIALAKAFGESHEVDYLSSVKPDLRNFGHVFEEFPNLNWIPHTGYNSYRDTLLEKAHEYDAIILGAAIANLIPVNPWEGKFPSHNYNEGDIIPIEFMVAPRIINMVKDKMKVGAHLFGFKLLDGVDHEELIDAAYEILLDSKATCVFANDRQALDARFAVTKERGEQLFVNDQQLVNFVSHLMEDTYYSTKLTHEIDGYVGYDKRQFAKRLLETYYPKLKKEYGSRKYLFGTVAVRLSRGFVTTDRGKKDLDQLTHVLKVDHDKREVVINANFDPFKASLNAPLLGYIFDMNKNVDHIVHYHEQVSGLPTVPYAPAGTTRDTIRLVTDQSFNIEGHGTILLFNEEGKRL